MDRKTAIEAALDKHVRGIVMAEWEKLTRKPEPAPLESTPWLRRCQSGSRCGHSCEQNLTFQRDEFGWVAIYKCPECGFPTVDRYEEAPTDTAPSPAPNAVHERLEKGGCGWAERAQGYRDWHAPGTKSSWFPCPCDSCAKARGE